MSRLYQNSSLSKKIIIYDENGMVTSFILKNGTTENIYFYVRDIFGIINYLIDSTGTTVVFYSYDSWGKLLSTGGTLSSTVGVQNPFLYKGYYFDFETSLYYCHSRYYNPMWRRWLNADSVDNLDEKSSNGFNLFAYCGNNPVNRDDSSGKDWNQFWKNVVVCVTAAGLILLTVTAVVASGGALLIPVLIGAGIGAVASLVGQGVGATAGAVGSLIAGESFGSAEFWINTAFGVMASFGIGAFIGAVAGGIQGASSWYTARVLEFTNAGSNEVVLGRSGVYEQIAQERNATYFHTLITRWNEVKNMFGVGNRGMWQINKVFLNQQIVASKTFLLASNPAISGGYFFLKEVAYLGAKGILITLL